MRYGHVRPERSRARKRPPEKPGAVPFEYCRYLVLQHVRPQHVERRIVFNPGSRREFQKALGQSHLSQKIPATATRCVYLDHLLSVLSTVEDCTTRLRIRQGYAIHDTNAGRRDGVFGDQALQPLLPSVSASSAVRTRPNSASRRSTSTRMCCSSPERPAFSSSAQMVDIFRAPMLPELPLRACATRPTDAASPPPIASRRAPSLGGTSSTNISASSARSS